MRLFKRLFGKPAPAPKPAAPAPKPKKAPKPDAFLDSVARYEARLKEHWAKLPPMDATTGSMAFLITPWLSSAVPMFSIETALLIRKQGHAVSLIMDDTEVAQNAENAKHREAIRRMVAGLADRVAVIDMAHEPAAEGAPDLEAAKGIAASIAIWYERGEANAGAYFERNPNAVERIAAHFLQVRAMLTRIKPKRLFIPGGIFGLSSIYCRIAAELGIPFVTFDAGPTIMIASKNAPAAHRKDVTSVCQRINAEATPEELEKMHGLAMHEFNLRTKGKDALSFQSTSDGAVDGERYDVLVPLNLRWDAAALNCERVFPSCMAWLEALLEWIEKDGRFSVCLREHPIGRLAIAASREDYSPLMRRFNSLGARLRHITPEESINTYDLMRGAKVVLPFTSTVGIEASMVGKPVVVHTDCYYRELGFCWDSSSPHEYLRLVQEALEGKLVIDDKRRELATTAFYVTQCCSFLAGDFNPNPEPFERWCNIPPDELLASTNAGVFIQSLVDDEDLPMLLHKSRMAA